MPHRKSGNQTSINNINNNNDDSTDKTDVQVKHAKCRNRHAEQKIFQFTISSLIKDQGAH